MRCAKCGTEGIVGKKFCAECGSPLPNRCSKCGSDNALGAKFCADCGTALVAATLAATPAEAVTPAVRITEPGGAAALEGERKTVTALFADIKGSMELIEDLDPEEARAIVDPALKLMIDAVQHYGGYVSQSTGDGVFALFGAPVAHEDHPQRALLAALRMQEELKHYSDRLRVEGRLPLQARVGVNTGEVVVRSITTGDGRAEYAPVGHSTGLAARMQALAPIGSIAATQRTQRLCEGYFAFKSLGPTTIKGVSEQINVFEVTGLGPPRTRLQVAARRGLTKFVGRQAELEQMKHALELTRQGHGQVVGAMGEPGVGKSRLFFEFQALAQAGCLVLEACSVSYGKASAYLPAIDLLKAYFEIANEDDERKRREKVNGKIITLYPALEDTLPYLFGLLGITAGDDPLTQLDPQLRRRRTLEAVKRVLMRESLSQPLILIFEDLHWIDSETQALLDLIVEGLATARILLLVNYRPEFRHQWGNKTYYTQLRLDPLGKASAQDMLTALLGGGDAGIFPLKRLIIERTEGNPFFMEEMIQTLFEQGVLERNGVVKLAKPLEDIRVPPTVQAILASRIDRLAAAEKELLQTLAVLGREFALRLVKRLTGKADDQLEPMLTVLQSAEFVYEQPALPDVEYIFKHALTQEVAYNSVLTERRRELHERVAQSIEELFADRLEDRLTELAHHFDRSGNLPKAVEYLGRAGVRAAEQWAHSEAIGYLTRALELLPRLPDRAARDNQELDLQMALSWSMFAARGPQAPGRESALVRARELCERLGENAKLMEALLGLAHLLNQSDFGLARELAERVLAMAQRNEAPAILGGAHFVLGLVQFAAGQFPEAHEHLENAVENLGAGPPRTHGANYVAFAPGFLGAVLIVLGYPLTAESRGQDLLAAARRRSDPYSIGTALFGDGLHHVLLRDPRMVAERADEMLSVATEHEMALLLNVATFFRGWAMAWGGRAKEGIAQMHRSISDPMVAEASPTALMIAVLAETCGQNGRVEEGLDLVARGLETADRIGLTVAEAELHRIKGELLLTREPPDEEQAERCLRVAIDVARGQSARLFELRATTSLARLLATQGKRDEARAKLAEIYGWFTEGFDTADLKDAKALLDELSA